MTVANFIYLINKFANQEPPSPPQKNVLFRLQYMSIVYHFKMKKDYIDCIKLQKRVIRLHTLTKILFNCKIILEVSNFYAVFCVSYRKNINVQLLIRLLISISSITLRDQTVISFFSITISFNAS